MRTFIVKFLQQHCTNVRAVHNRDKVQYFILFSFYIFHLFSTHSLLLFSHLCGFLIPRVPSKEWFSFLALIIIQKTHIVLVLLLVYTKLFRIISVSSFVWPMLFVKAVRILSCNSFVEWNKEQILLNEECIRMLHIYMRW